MLKNIKNIKNRNSSIEMLRTLSMAGVILLHYNEDVCHALSFLYNSFSFSTLFLLSIEELSICAVYIYILISGYYMCKLSQINFEKPFILVFEVVFFKEMVYIIQAILKPDESISLVHLVGALIPNNWFVVLYITLFIISPYLNRLLSTLSKKQFKYLILISFILFSAYPTLQSVLESLKGESIRGLSTIGIAGAQNGYTIVNFILIYLIGAYIRIAKVNISRMKNVCLAIISFCLMIIWTCYDFWGNRDIIVNEYSNSILIFYSIMVFLLFVSMNERHNPVVNFLAKQSFVVYLIHPYLLSFFNAEQAISDGIWSIIFQVVTAIIVIYIVGCIVGFVWDMIEACLSMVLNKYFKLKIDLINDNN